ncbi:class I tRNA ligase family protein [uncultured Fibrobacter sp.]|uniref:class I tRNA ligase family protein n=1 Tax=uncultured Fibrobacter sp. TaxID=261512 RepID=UPI0025F94CEB|nr:class I tRNA ligase family protein [uncultured Fibrobacter sp.]
MKTQAFSLHSLPWLSNFETNLGYKDRQDPSLTLIFPLNTDEAKFKDFGHLVWTTTPWTLYSNFCIVVGPDMDYNLVEQDGKKYWIAASRTAAYFKNPNIVDTCKGSELVGKDYEPLSRISDAFVTPDQLSRHYKIVFMEGGSIPLVRTSLFSTPTAGLRRRPATPRLPHPPAQNWIFHPFFFCKIALFDGLGRF